jgi:hypothetical protein
LLVIVRCFELRWRDVVERLKEPTIVEPIDPRECRELDGLAALPGTLAIDHLCLEEAVDGLSKRVVVRVAL